MSDEQWSARHPVSGRHAYVDDDGDSAWLYLTEADGYKVAADCWLYNRRRFAPAELAKWPRDRPPPATDDHVDAGGLRSGPLPSPVTFIWDERGDSVAVRAADEVLGFIAAGDRRGHSQYLRQVGPWGTPFDDALFRRLFEDGGPAA
jgi:hypothetical protein